MDRLSSFTILFGLGWAFTVVAVWIGNDIHLGESDVKIIREAILENIPREPGIYTPKNIVAVKIEEDGTINMFWGKEKIEKLFPETPVLESAPVDTSAY